MPAFEKQRKADVLNAEIAGIEQIKQLLGDTTGKEISDLWHDCENLSSPEARFVKALDRLEVRLQHNEADISTWNDAEYPRSLFAADKFCNFDKSLKELNEMIKAESSEKIADSGKDLAEVKLEAEKLRKE